MNIEVNHVRVDNANTTVVPLGSNGVVHFMLREIYIPSVIRSSRGNKNMARGAS